MKRIIWITLAALMLFITAEGCSPATTEPTIPPITLDSPSTIKPGSVKASAVVVPAQETRLSFVISGPIKDVTVNEGDIVEAGQKLASLSSPELEFGLLQAEAAVRAAEFEHEYWRFPRMNRPPERRQLAEQELITVQKSLDTARAELNQNTLSAPFAATVISVEVLPGEYVQPGQVVIALATINKLQIETTDLSELNIAEVEIGQPATVFIEALGKEFPGEVTAISPISDTIGGDVVFKVTIHLDEQPKDLLWGMSADVEIDAK